MVGSEGGERISTDIIGFTSISQLDNKKKENPPSNNPFQIQAISSLKESEIDIENSVIMHQSIYVPCCFYSEATIILSKRGNPATLQFPSTVITLLYRGRDVARHCIKVPRHCA